NTLTFSGDIAIGTAPNIFKADVNGIYLGDAVFANAPFSVTAGGVLSATGAIISGTIDALSGTIGGWTINADNLAAANNDIVLDPSGRLTVGGTYGQQVTLDSATGTANATWDKIAAFDGVWLASEGDDAGIPNLGTAGATLSATNTGLVRIEGPAIWFPGSAGNNASTSVNVNMTGVTAFNVKVRVDLLASSGSSTAIIGDSYGGGTNTGWGIRYNGTLNQFGLWFYDGVSARITNLVLGSEIASNGPLWLGYELSTSGGDTRVDGYYSYDNVNWTALGGQTWVGNAFLPNPGNNKLIIGRPPDFDGSGQFKGQVYEATVRTGSSTLGQGNIFFALSGKDISTTEPSATSFTATSGHTLNISRSASGPVTTIVPSGVVYLNPADGVGSLSVVANDVFDLAADEDFVIGFVGTIGNQNASFPRFAGWNSGTNAIHIYKNPTGNPNRMTLEYKISGVGQYVGPTEIPPPHEPVVFLGRLNRVTGLLYTDVFTLSGNHYVGSTVTATAGAIDSTFYNFNINIGTLGSAIGALWNKGIGVAPSDAEIAEIANFLLRDTVVPPASKSASIRIGGTGEFNQRADTIYLGDNQFSIGKDNFRYDGAA
ncbi:MAG TPA: hypothetical protein V6D20_06750, partial [Candidatus Obscuribacterales bacterium]